MQPSQKWLCLLSIIALDALTFALFFNNSIHSPFTADDILNSSSKHLQVDYKYIPSANNIYSKFIYVYLYYVPTEVDVSMKAKVIIENKDIFQERLNGCRLKYRLRTWLWCQIPKPLIEASAALTSQ